MLCAIWTVLALPVVVTGMILHFQTEKWGKKRWGILPKCMSTWMIVGTAILGIRTTLDASGLGKKWILAALILFLIADGLLELSFFAGMAVFGAGHLILIGWFIARGGIHPYTALWWILFLGGALLLFRRELKESLEKPCIRLMVLYHAVLMGMTAIAVTLPLRFGPDYLWAAVGAVLFAVSDLMVGKGFFRKLSLPADVLALGMYYAGIFCIAMMTWI